MRALSRPPRRRVRFRVSRGRPTPIWISRRARTLLIVAGVVVLLLLLRAAPTVLIVALGGLALALVMLFPVRLLALKLPWGWAIALSFLLVVGLLALGIAVLVPILAEQLGALVTAAPDYLRRGENVLRGLLEPLTRRGFVPGTPDQFMARLGRDLVDAAQSAIGGILGQAGKLVAGTFNTFIMLFGMLFIAVYLLVDERKIKAAYLHAAPERYRHDARELWDAFGYTLSRYLSGLGLSLAIQGAVSALALYLLGVPFALLLGFWVAITALIPYIGAFAGAVPAVALALTVSPTTALFTALVFLGIQQLEGNILTPKIQGDALRMHPIFVFLAVIAGGELAGLVGVLFAIPALAVLRVLLDFFSARLRTVDRREPIVAQALPAPTSPSAPLVSGPPRSE
ncbi:MAG: AI-2E family transporter [Gemmatimonadales bacterium]|nr:AI-2E family transporter [Gemmatimonadales bacterium]